jgi:glycosyltransferase involved in cell wall biosynthesis
MPLYMAACDMLLSYRQIGTNTPLKLYSYLWSGKPTVATDLLVHTQVLDRDVAVLTEPTVEAFADGVIALARDPGLRARLGNNARLRAEERYSYRVHLNLIKNLYRHVQDLALTALTFFLTGWTVNLISSPAVEIALELT